MLDVATAPLPSCLSTQLIRAEILPHINHIDQIELHSVMASQTNTKHRQLKVEIWDDQSKVLSDILTSLMKPLAEA